MHLFLSTCIKLQALMILDLNSLRIVHHCYTDLLIFYTFNLTLRKHTIPLEWCTHCIVSVFKSGDRGSVSNYRPISLLCNTSKLLEKLVYDKITDHLNPLVTALQFGFFKNRSVTQQLLIVFNNIINTPHQTDILTFVKHLTVCPTISCYLN